MQSRMLITSTILPKKLPLVLVSKRDDIHPWHHAGHSGGLTSAGSVPGDTKGVQLCSGQEGRCREMETRKGRFEDGRDFRGWSQHNPISRHFRLIV